MVYYRPSAHTGPGRPGWGGGVSAKALTPPLCFDDCAPARRRWPLFRRSVVAFERSLTVPVLFDPTDDRGMRWTCDRGARSREGSVNQVPDAHPGAAANSERSWPALAVCRAAVSAGGGVWRLASWMPLGVALTPADNSREGIGRSIDSHTERNHASSGVGFRRGVAV